jgi:hypothetical protein
MIENGSWFTVAATVRPPPPDEIPELALMKSKTKKLSAEILTAELVIVVWPLIVLWGVVVVVMRSISFSGR